MKVLKIEGRGGDANERGERGWKEEMEEEQIRNGCKGEIRKTIKK